MSDTKYRERAGSYMTFDLNGELHGIDTMRVIAVIEMQHCTPLPQAPKFVKGLTMVRGKVIPVIDTRMRLGLTETVVTDQTCIILLTSGTMNIGIMVEAIQRVIDIAEEQFDDIDQRIGNEYLVGVAKLDKKVVTLLDIDQVVRFF